MKIKPGTIIFLFFLAVLAMCMYWWISDSAANQKAALEQTQYIDGIGVRP